VRGVTANADSERAATLARTAASMLTLGSGVALVTAVLTLAAFIALGLGWQWQAGWLASVLLGLVGACYAFRLRFDAKLFVDLAARLDAGAAEALALGHLDAALNDLRLCSARVAARPLAERARAALRLLYVQASIAFIQLVLSTLLLCAPR
jgi:hypothetical protein